MPLRMVAESFSVCLLAFVQTELLCHLLSSTEEKKTPFKTRGWRTGYLMKSSILPLQQMGGVAIVLD
jgi:hypothetical protein